MKDTTLHICHRRNFNGPESKDAEMNTGNEEQVYGTTIAEPGTKILGLSPGKIFRQNDDGLAGIRREIDLRVAEVQLGWSIRDRINRRRASLLTMANLGKLLDQARPL